MYFWRKNLQRLGASLAVITLLLSFGMHAVQVDHEHPNTAPSHQHTPMTTAHEETVPDASATFVFLADHMHHSDKKWLLLLIASMFATVVITSRPKLLERKQRALETTLSLWLYNIYRTKTFNYLLLYFSSGRLNPKLY